MPSDKTISVCFKDLKVDDIVVIWDRNHSAHGARGKVYCSNREADWFQSQQTGAWILGWVALTAFRKWFPKASKFQGKTHAIPR